MRYKCEECNEKVEKLSDLKVHNIKEGIKLVCNKCYKFLNKHKIIYICSICTRHWKPTYNENSWKYKDSEENIDLYIVENKTCPNCRSIKILKNLYIEWNT